MKTYPLTTNERAELGLTLAVEITADDLTMTTVTTGQTLTANYIFAIGEYVERVTTFLKTAFKDANDAASILSPMSVGDSVGGVATILAAIELNENGTEILNKTAVPTGVPSTGFTAASNLTMTFGTPTSGKAYVNIDVGCVIVGIRSFRPSLLAKAISPGPILTK